MTDWAGRTAVEIAAAVREKRATPREVVAEHLARIERLDGRVGAFRAVRAQAALAEAEEVAARGDLGELPLAGVPVAVKDNLAVRGESTRVGSAATPHTPADADHVTVARLRAAGAVVVGLTNVPELCVFGTTEGVLGTARNPWDPARSAGGSSGGSAAAVAAGMVPLALGNDGMGSLRIPAANCGLVALKPGRGCGAGRLRRRRRPADKELQVAGLVAPVGRLLWPGSPAARTADAVRPLLGARVARLVRRRADPEISAHDDDLVSLRQADEEARTADFDAGVLEDWRTVLELTAARNSRLGAVD
ncbi:Glutamyl-tRNA(Gln) amidotransferase subunit A, chloroplastic/mitochondrial [Streptomyces violaceorubidus]